MFKYFKDLLYLHDCVIIPGFGAFVGNAEHSSTKKAGSVYPPFKTIFFNKSIVNNDGLLANHIAVKENISYQEANNRIIEFREELKEELNRNTRVVFPDLGVLYSEKGSHIYFEQSRQFNYLAESFGLFPVTLPEEKNLIPSDTAKPFADRSAIPASKKKNNFGWKEAIAFPIACALVWGSFQVIEYTDNSNYQYGDLNPLKLKSTEVFQNTTPVNTSDYSSYSSFNPWAKTTVDEVPALAETSSNKFFIVAACFSDKANALKMVQELREKGYHSADICGTDKGLVVVSYKGFKSQEEAWKKLTPIQIYDNLEAWIFAKSN